MLTNSILLINSGYETLKPPSIQFRLFANSVQDTKYHKDKLPYIT
jgi:hypothetical protein